MASLLTADNNRVLDKKQKGFAWIPFLLISGLVMGGLSVAGLYVDNAVLDTAAKIGLFIVGILLAVLSYISGFFFCLAVDICNWLSHLAMEIEITKGWAYDYGWTMTRDLTNMLFTIILVFIGLATILKIRNYEAGKILPKLLIIALLINFSGVIVGFVIDFFDLLTNFFIQKISFTDTYWGPISLINSHFADLWNGLVNWNEDTGVYLGRVVGVTFIGIFFLFGAFVLAAVGIVYLLRTVIFWILFILAPLAFAAFILPATKRLWNLWWQQIIQWGLVGLIISFFLFLSSKFLGVGSTIFRQEELQSALEQSARGAGGVMPPGLASTIAMSLPYVVSFIFLIIGLALTKQNAPLVAKQIFNWAEKGFKTTLKAGAALGTLAVGGAAGKAAKGLGGVARMGAGVESKAGKAGAWAGGKVGGVKGAKIGGKISRWAARPISGVSRLPQAILNPQLLNLAEASERVKLPKDFGKWSADRQEELIKAKLLTSRQRLQASLEMGGNLAFISPEFKKQLSHDAAKNADNPSLQKGIRGFYKFYPEEASGDSYIKMKMSEKTTKEEKDQAGIKARKKIANRGETIEEEMGKNEGVKEEIINLTANKFKVKKDKITDAQIRITLDDLSAQNIIVEGLKGKDVSDIVNPDTFASRWAMQRQTPKTIQVIEEYTDRETMENIFEKPGGINQRFSDAIKNNDTQKQRELVEELQTINATLLRWFFINPAGQAYNFAGRDIIEKSVKEGGYGGFENFQKTVKGRHPAAPQNLEITPPSGPRVSEERLKEAREAREELRRKKRENT